MKKVALIFVVAVLVPSLVLAWLAVRSLRDQQFLLERQQALLYQKVTDTLAQNVSSQLALRQQEFAFLVESQVTNRDVWRTGASFDAEIRRRWPLAEVGFCVTLTGKILSPTPDAHDQALEFYTDNGRFLGNREAVEVYNSVTINNAADQGGSYGQANGGIAQGGRYDAQQTYQVGQPAFVSANNATITLAPAPSSSDNTSKNSSVGNVESAQRSQNLTSSYGNNNGNGYGNTKSMQQRKITPQNEGQQLVAQSDVNLNGRNNYSRAMPAEGEFRQLIGTGKDGLLARFLQNKLKLLVWHRLKSNPDYVFGAQLNLKKTVADLRQLVQVEPALRNEICLVLLDDNAKPVILSRPDFQANWKRPFVATEIGDALPHWEVAAYLVNPEQLTRAAQTAQLTLGLFIVVLLLAIGVGSFLIVSDLNSELKLARQKTDFVSNVSHELKTPLTSIRMFSELLAEGRVSDAAKQRSYLNIITAEAARLTRLINNVLDFSRMESGEKKYNFQPCDLNEIVRATAETFRPHLETAGFKFECELPTSPVSIRGDTDALSQIVVNLLSNAEKYSNGGKEISLSLAQKQSPLPHAEIRVMDRGTGVPRGCEDKIFEKFYRAHDSLGSGIQGSGLGLTIARQIARAHGGDVAYERREGGGSCFIFRLPISTTDGHK